jgi:hypothetical protein
MLQIFQIFVHHFIFILIFGFFRTYMIVFAEVSKENWCNTYQKF